MLWNNCEVRNTKIGPCATRALPRLSIAQEESFSCARDQVVIAGLPVLTPPWCYRRSLVSKGRFATLHIHQDVICVGIRSSLLPKKRYRVARGDRLGAIACTRTA
jgi:hypothetical protein